MKKTIIHTDKIYLSDDNKVRHITGIENCSSEADLPSEYLTGYPAYWRTVNGVRVKPDENRTIYIRNGALLDEDFFQELVGVMRKAGNRLYGINQRLKWCGQESVEI
jgi:hypothetical protein